MYLYVHESLKCRGGVVGSGWIRAGFLFRKAMTLSIEKEE